MAPPQLPFPSISLTTPPSVPLTPFLSYSFVTVPPIQMEKQALQSQQLLWMADLFRQAASIAEQSGNGSGFGNGQQQPIIDQQQSIKNTIVDSNPNNKLRERQLKQLSTEKIIVQSPSNEMPPTALMNEEIQRQRVR
jgi:hypothetical protein